MPVQAQRQLAFGGEAYQVKCGARAPVASGPWLRAELQTLRAGR